MHDLIGIDDQGANTIGIYSQVNSIIWDIVHPGKVMYTNIRKSVWQFICVIVFCKYH